MKDNQEELGNKPCEKLAVVLLSGGLDSATTLAIARKRGFVCRCLSFDYSQRHRLELDAARRVAQSGGAAEHRIVKIDLSAAGGFGKSALTDRINVPTSFTSNGNIPVTYVPARNTIFLSIALGYAEVVGAFDIFIGVTAVDYSGYPDCRPQFIQAFQELANLATAATASGKTGEHGDFGQRFTIHAPLIDMSKEQIIRTGLALGVDYSLTSSCYDPAADGAACGLCDSCRLRLAGFAKAEAKDPIRYQ